MIDSIKRYVQEQNMFAEGDYVVAGVSGGADSICLLCVLLELRLEIPMTIQVVHINHKIREEAGEDADLTDVGGEEVLQHGIAEASRAAGDQESLVFKNCVCHDGLLIR